MKRTLRCLALVLALLMVFACFAACKKKPAAGADTYTYNYALSEFPTNWSYTNNQTAIDSEILDYISAGFYTFDYNEAKDGYKMVDSMAVGDPKDVTAQYVGKYGIVEGDTNKAYVIKLRDDLKWEDGTKITAKDFVESAKRLLDPKAQNHRADLMYSGSVSIVGAENYLKQGKSGKFAAVDVVDAYSTDIDDKLFFKLAPESKDEPAQAAFRKLIGFPASYDAAMTAEYLAANVVKNPAFNATVAATMEGKTLAEIKADATMKAAWDALIGAWQTEPNEELHFFLSEYTYPALEWDNNVGWFALSDTELCFVMSEPLDGFYLKYGLPAPLIHLATYDACAKEEDGVYTNTYCTDVQTTKSFGPYKLVSFQADKQYVLERNENFFGLTADTYQTTKIVVDCVPTPSTRLELFLQGKLDTYGLTIDDMATYQMSDYTYYSTGASTFAIAFNPNLEALTASQAKAGANINKTILTVPEFRMAMSFALDRNAFCLATSPLNGPAFGLFSSLIVSDPEAGTAYRTTDVAKEVLAKFWGVADQYGEGKLYPDIDAAIDSITGYNLAKARELFNAAYDKAIADGLMDADDVIEIKIGTPNNTSKFYNNGYEFLKNNYEAAVKGTKLEGKLTFSRDHTLGNDFSDYLKNNTVDMLFGVGWQGAELDPYGLMEAYLAPKYQYDASVDFTKVNVTVKIDGVDYTTDAVSWYDIMNGKKVDVKGSDGKTKTLSCGAADKNPALRLEILGALEGIVLQNYNFIPVMDEAGANLRGRQIKYYTEEYIFGMGFGGLKYYTYEYSDAEWDEYVKKNNGTLDYT